MLGNVGKTLGDVDSFCSRGMPCDVSKKVQTTRQWWEVLNTNGGVEKMSRDVDRHLENGN